MPAPRSVPVAADDRATTLAMIAFAANSLLCRLACSSTDRRGEFRQHPPARRRLRWR
jgi:hypothetical protein